MPSIAQTAKKYISSDVQFTILHAFKYLRQWVSGFGGKRVDGSLLHLLLDGSEEDEERFSNAVFEEFV